MPTLLIAYGTRPEAIKLGPVIRELRQSRLESIVITSGQHREMLDEVNDLFDVRPDLDLSVMQPRQTLEELTARVFDGYSSALRDLRPDALLVQGDTTTSFVAALCGFYAKVPVVHLEAGLRTNDRYAPFPEEINRRLTTQLSSLHLAPTNRNRAALLREGINPDVVVVTGNTVIDALIWASKLRQPFDDSVLEAASICHRRIVLVTAHRREAWGQGMNAIASGIARVAEAFPDVLFVFPMHRNPIVRESLLPALVDHENIYVREPMPYGKFARLIGESSIIVTDSGGLQEEAPGLGKPTLVLREETERVEAVEVGAAKLVGLDTALIVAELSNLLANQAAYDSMARTASPYGDGVASARVRKSIEHLLGLGPQVQDFVP